MGNLNIGLSLFMVAAGAILTWAVSAEVAGIDITVVGVILMVVGLVGVALSMIFWSSFAPSRRREVREIELVELDPPMPRR